MVHCLVSTTQIYTIKPGRRSSREFRRVQSRALWAKSTSDSNQKLQVIWSAVPSAVSSFQWMAPHMRT